MIVTYQVQGFRKDLERLRKALWNSGRISSAISPKGTLFVTIRNAGELKKLQSACNALGLVYH